MKGPSDRDKIAAARSRTVAVVIVATMLAWMAVQLAGARLAIPGRVMGLVDLAALGALAWAVFVAATLWRARRDKE